MSRGDPAIKRIDPQLLKDFEVAKLLPQPRLTGGLAVHLPQPVPQVPGHFTIESARQQFLLPHRVGVGRRLHRKHILGTIFPQHFRNGLGRHHRPDHPQGVGFAIDPIDPAEPRNGGPQLRSRLLDDEVGPRVGRDPQHDVRHPPLQHPHLRAHGGREPTPCPQPVCRSVFRQSIHALALLTRVSPRHLPPTRSGRPLVSHNSPRSLPSGESHGRSQPRNSPRCR